MEIASEFRYRKSAVRRNSLMITLSQSGETADTLAALAAKILPADSTFALLPLVDSFYDEDAQSAAHARKYADVLVAVAVGHAQAFDRPTQRRMAESGVDVFVLAPFQQGPVDR